MIHLPQSRLLVLVPARDEAPRLPAMLARLRATLPGAPLLVVDGESTDGTPEVARRCGARVMQQEASGYCGALLTGYREFLRGDAEALLLLDADGQHPPEAGPRLLQALPGADWVVGSRDGTGSPGPMIRRGGNALMATMAWLLTGARLRDVTSGYQALSRETAACFVEALEEGARGDLDLRVLAALRGLRIREVPVYMPERAAGASMHGGLAGVGNFARSVAAAWRASRETSGPTAPHGTLQRGNAGL